MIQNKLRRAGLCPALLSAVSAVAIAIGSAGLVASPAQADINVPGWVPFPNENNPNDGPGDFSLGNWADRAGAFRLLYDQDDPNKSNLQGVSRDRAANGNIFLYGELWIPDEEDWQNAENNEFIRADLGGKTAENTAISPAMQFTTKDGNAAIRVRKVHEGNVWEVIDLAELGVEIERDSWNRFDIRIYPGSDGEPGAYEYLFNGEVVYRYDELDPDTYDELHAVYLRIVNNTDDNDPAHWSRVLGGTLIGEGNTLEADLAGDAMAVGDAGIGDGVTINGTLFANGDADNRIGITAGDGVAIEEGLISLHSDVSFGDDADIDGDVVAENSSLSFGDKADIDGDVAAENSVLSFGDEARIGGNLGLSDHSSIAGGSADLPINIVGNVNVDENSLLGGNLDVDGNVTVAGRHAPGNSIGVTVIGGNYGLADGATLEVEIDGLDSDRVEVGGNATLDGALEVKLIDGADYEYRHDYEIISTVGGVDGNSTAIIDGVWTDIAWVGKEDNYFIDPMAIVQGDDVILTFDRNGELFEVAADTVNELAVAGGLEGLYAENPDSGLVERVARLSLADAHDALHQMTGEIHASLRTGLMEESGHLRSTVTDRIASAFAGESQVEDAAAWGRLYGNWGRTSSDGNASRLRRDKAGIVTGIDLPFDEFWRAGALFGYSQSDHKANGDAARVRTFHAGLYGGGTFDALRLSGGFLYSWHDIDTNRLVAFGKGAHALNESLHADYRGWTSQIFGEAAYRVQMDSVAIEPYAGLAYVHLKTRGFDEGVAGLAALSSEGRSDGIGFSTIGLRGSAELDFIGLPTRLNAGVAWRHAFSDVRPLEVGFNEGGDPFAISGVPLGRNIFQVDLGAEFGLSDFSTLSLSYQGEFGDGVRMNGGKALLSVKF